MAGAPSPVRVVMRRYRSALALLLAWMVPILYGRIHVWQALRDWVEDAVIRILSGFPAMQLFASRFQQAVLDALFEAFGVSLFFATLAIPLGFAARMVARASVRAGHADPLDRVRGLVSARPRWTAAILAVPVALAQAVYMRLSFRDFLLEDLGPATLVAIAAAMGALEWRLARAGLRAWLAPTLDESAPAAEALDADEIHFDAVAVTRGTRAMVGGMAAVSFAAVAWMASLDLQRLYREAGLFTLMLSYVVVTALGAFAFQRASRISVGVDGIRVGGTSRTRFFAYRDLDEVRERAGIGGDIELCKRGRVLLRLQLHGKDATRRAAILARIRDAIARVADVERDGAANFVSSASPGAVTRAMRGGADYRVPAVSRDALWSLVEGTGVDGAARTAAARAIVETGSPDERARLRVAAGHCADPHVRIALEELADESSPEPAQSTLQSPKSSRA